MKSVGYIFAVCLIGCNATEKPLAQQPSQASPAIQQKPKSERAAIDAPIVEPIKTKSRGTPLRLSLNVGDKQSHILQGSIQVKALANSPPPPPQALQTSTFKIIYTKEVTSIENGIATLKVTSTPLEVEKKEARGQWVARGQKGEIKIDARGRVYSDLEGLVSGVLGFGLIPFPNNNVEKGSVWKRTISRNMPPFGDVRLDEMYTFEGKMLRDGVPVYKISMKGAGSLPGLQIRAQYFYRIPTGALYGGDLRESAIIAVPGTEAKPSRVRITVVASARPK